MIPAADAVAANFSMTATTATPRATLHARIPLKWTLRSARIPRRTRRSADHRDEERRRGWCVMGICPHVDEGIALSRSRIIDADAGAVRDRRDTRHRSRGDQYG